MSIFLTRVNQFKTDHCPHKKHSDDLDLQDYLKIETILLFFNTLFINIYTFKESLQSFKQKLSSSNWFAFFFFFKSE